MYWNSYFPLPPIVQCSIGLNQAACPGQRFHPTIVVTLRAIIIYPLLCVVSPKLATYPLSVTTRYTLRVLRRARGQNSPRLPNVRADYSQTPDGFPITGEEPVFPQTVPICSRDKPKAPAEAWVNGYIYMWGFRDIYIYRVSEIVYMGYQRLRPTCGCMNIRSTHTHM